MYKFHVIKYFKATIDFGLIYKQGVGNPYMIGYSDSDFVGGVEDRKSTMRKVFFPNGLPSTWKSLKQKVVVLTSCDA